jgi:hypothetical protein
MKFEKSEFFESTFSILQTHFVFLKCRSVELFLGNFLKKNYVK